jgi:hypothetical protein
MSDITYSMEEIAKFVSEKLPQFQRTVILDFVALNTVDEKQLDKVGLELSGENKDEHMIVSAGIHREKVSVNYAPPFFT